MSDVPTLTTVTVRYYAAARAAAGVESERLDVPTGGTVGDVLAAIRARHGAELARVLQRCSYLLDEVAVRNPATPLPEAATVDVLPPFAGG
jgi:sulfur-carrier protein